VVVSRESQFLLHFLAFILIETRLAMVCILDGSLTRKIGRQFFLDDMLFKSG